MQRMCSTIELHGCSPESGREDNHQSLRGPNLRPARFPHSPPPCFTTSWDSLMNFPDYQKVLERSSPVRATTGQPSALLTSKCMQEILGLAKTPSPPREPQLYPIFLQQKSGNICKDFNMPMHVSRAFPFSLTQEGIPPRGCVFEKQLGLLLQNYCFTHTRILSDKSIDQPFKNHTICIYTRE